MVKKDPEWSVGHFQISARENPAKETIKGLHLVSKVFVFDLDKDEGDTQHLTFHSVDHSLR